MFCVHEKVVYPGHGVAQIQRIIKKNINGKEASFYELVFLNKDMTILVPTENANAVGLRSLSSHEYILGVFSFLTEPPEHSSTTEFTPANWSKRNKEYQTKIKNGNLRELCGIYRDLHAIAGHKELSFGERTLLQQIESLLVEEISLVEKVGAEKTMEHLRSLCSNNSEKEFENSAY